MAQQIDTENMIRQALNENSPLVQFQPIVNLKIPAMACYAMQFHIEGTDNRLLSERDLRRPGVDAELQYEFDRWIVSRALKSLLSLRKETPLSRLYVNLSGATVTNPEFPDWVSRQLKLNEMVGAGLIFSFRISDITKNINGAYKNFHKLQKINIETCISQFPDNPKAFELLKFFRAEYLSVTTRLLKADKGTIKAMVDNAHKLKCKILLTDIDNAESIELNWATGADLLQGRYIQGYRDEMNFEFG